MRSLLIYGESGTYKSTNCGEIVRRVFEIYGKKSRLVTSDSSFGPMLDQVEEGILQPILLGNCKNPLAVLRLVCKGMWPSKANSSGWFDENSLKKVTPQEWEEWGGCLVIEGLHMNACLLQQDIVGKGRDTGEPLQAKFQELGLNFAHGSRGTFGFVQAQTQAYVNDAKSLPIEWLVVTSHEGKGDDLVTKKSVFGPAVLGKSLTDKVPAWFENTVHSESYQFQTKDGQKKKGVRSHFNRHPDAEVSNVFWPAKLGVTPKDQKRVERRWPNLYIPLRIDEEGNYKSSIADLIEEIVCGRGEEGDERKEGYGEREIEYNPQAAQSLTKQEKGEGEE